jgi:hypothetical protein
LKKIFKIMSSKFLHFGYIVAKASNCVATKCWDKMIPIGKLYVI